MIRFSKYIWLYVLLSSFVLIPGVYSLLRWGLRPSVDFTGGTVLEVKSEKPLARDVIQALAKKNSIDLIEITQSPGNSYTFRMKPTAESTVDVFQQGLHEEGGGGTIDILKKDTVGPVIGKELLYKTVVSSIFVLIAILSYVAYAFKSVKFGISAIASLIHDMLVMFGSFSLLGHFFGVEVDTLFVTAFLTTMSFSVHDTIVIFDRIREYRRKDTRTKLSDVCDVALTETMGRSLVNSFTIIFMLLSLALMGGATVRWFAVALLIGTITGTYSSPFVATPVLLLLDRWERNKSGKF
ncbi:MAG: SecF protein [Candidatus Gottesmanbacteria bacterium GW2011_GWA2_44_17]|uniref:Protein-export membrane protein SecF n=3 Tax=Candidatus Gottesmaniibacteriota TaxID=1752720 RepID=A0A0G1KW70_9BACT|nr:MAG: preprotein translocase subunit SecF, preprotein translocase subunit SecF [Microgenomates group bacterium GW2011_GWC1_43_11]KKT38714.1 MAG: SecF protein [Candidatus Gottesmanbacteria bacterium GW2011_GWB1_44_11c]KKT47035.1 MAG: SecF protein [Candidatus Gottesmanbacteria bacterium GW2011_GWA2_44_17]KKT60572.1 MAG: SecF protein [Candidatus Gottesmanbacteria bacterium GW2011_GWA1_44_24b]HCM82602.1 protein translocase subunit SecF [Patescibacteria group bacterium]